MGEALGTVVSWTIGISLLLYASSGWWSRFFPFLKPSDEEIERFRKLNVFVVDCEDNLGLWVNRPPVLENAIENARDNQLDVTLRSFRILCRKLDELKVWTPPSIKDANIDVEIWSAYLFRLRVLTVQAALATARKRGSALADPLDGHLPE